MPKPALRTIKKRREDRLVLVGMVVDLVNKTALTLAILVGGGWAYYKYVLTESPSAQLALAEIKRICSERGSLDIKIEASSRNRILSGKIFVKNIGTRTVELDMRNVASPLTVAKIDLTSDNALKISKSASVKMPFSVEKEEAQSVTIFSVLPGRTLELPFVTRTAEPGSYLISFIGGPRDTVPTDEVCRTVTQNEVGADWAASAIHEVRDDTNLLE